MSCDVTPHADEVWALPLEPHDQDVARGLRSAGWGGGAARRLQILRLLALTSGQDLIEFEGGDSGKQGDPPETQPLEDRGRTNIGREQAEFAPPNLDGPATIRQSPPECADSLATAVYLHWAL